MDNVRDRVSLHDMKLHISTRNTKLGRIPSFSMLPTDSHITLSNGDLCTNVIGTCSPGTCASCKGSCYAVKSVRQYRETARAWAENTLLAQYDITALTCGVIKYCTKHKPRYFRMHVSGEFLDIDYMRAWAIIARVLPDTVFFSYTKRADLLHMYALQYGPLPDNMVIQYSAWNDIYAVPAGYPVFVYDDGSNAELSGLRHCPGADKNGKRTALTCEKCGYCMRCRPGDIMAVYAH